MDPASAIGVASGVLSFIDGATKILKLARVLYESEEGSVEEIEVRLRLAQSISDQSKQIIPADQHVPNDRDGGLVALAKDCTRLANDMKKELEKLKPKRRKSKTQSGLSALKILLGDSKISDLEKQLQRCRDQLHFHITSLSNENLRELLNRSKESGTKLTQLQASVDQLRRTLRDRDNELALAIEIHTLNRLEHILSTGEEALNEVARDRILKGIKAGFEDMHRRYQSIHRSFGKTFEWIFDVDGTTPEAENFTNWLSSGDGIFHICGKLGSGKSTLMKKLYGHPRTRTELEKWAHSKGSRKLIMAHFFFYALGPDSRQRSLMGLFRTLLYHVLTSNPELTKYLFPAQWDKALAQSKVHSHYEILDEDIEEAYERLAKHHVDGAAGQYCFSFFIDGLDEYQVTTSADRRRMVRYLLDLSNSDTSSFKICVSSRMENPFMDMFSETTRMYLHLLTKHDMEEYVHANLQDVGSVTERRELTLNIVGKAEGVFLWVALVVQKIRKHSDDGARFPRLLSEIESLPTEMDDLFQRILDTIIGRDRLFFNHTLLIIRYLETIPEKMAKYLWFGLDDFYFLEDYELNPFFAEDKGFPPDEVESNQERRTRAMRQLRGICRGLIEATSLEVDKYSNRLTFPHRSVGDFFHQEKVWTRIRDESFNEIEALSQLKLASLKQFWRYTMQATMLGTTDEWEKELAVVQRQSTMVACLLQQRREQRLDKPPFSFLESLDNIPGLSMSESVSRAAKCGRTNFHISHWEELDIQFYEVCHLSRVHHYDADQRFNSQYMNCSLLREQSDSRTMNCTLPCRCTGASNDLVFGPDDVITSRALVSPLLSEFLSCKSAYPKWILEKREDPLETEKLIAFVYCVIGYSIGRCVDSRINYQLENPDSFDWQELRDYSHTFLHALFQLRIVSPSLPTDYGFGAEINFVRIASGHQPLSIWQHFLCWWIVATASWGEFDELKEKEKATHLAEADQSRDDHLSTFRHVGVGLVLAMFIKFGAELELSLSIKYRGEIAPEEDDAFIAYTVEIFTKHQECLQVDVAVDLGSRLTFADYPYGLFQRVLDREHGAGLELLFGRHPVSRLPLKTWIERSELPDKADLLQLINKRMGLNEEVDVPNEVARRTG
ncbi:hypothetical protein F4778DRAFT_765090 [Xylariomycetidae sp. FL2044]|nr:hypothetical protein F4778DRAFT_765090 [Xylariomycetidae sp. FL2044]